MNKALSYIGIACIFFTFSSCKEQQHDNREEGARELFTRLADLTRLYTDSIVNAPDSADIDAIYSRYEKAFDDISTKVVPDTDLFMKEGENDTIVLLQRKLIETRRNRLASKKVHFATDTIEEQSEAHP
ncbi:MAG: hypothetical protein K2I91_05170 [Muribaculaceae bacterium]|nr:hypothetical protein [Muribaculaceae bacterium]